MRRNTLLTAGNFNDTKRRRAGTTQKKPPFNEEIKALKKNSCFCTNRLVKMSSKLKKKKRLKKQSPGGVL